MEVVTCWSGKRFRLEASVRCDTAIRPESGVKPTCRDTSTDAIDRAPRGRELSVREDLTRIIVDWSGSWQAARPGNWLGRSPATKAALGC
jgi:hypothetical protein